MTILLESDKDAAIQSHLDELSKRTMVVFITVASLTVVWSFSVDELLREFLALLHPCQGECLNVYDPAQWSAVRWLTALYLGFLSTLPLVVHHLHKFAKPGLTVHEYRALKRCTGIGTVMLLVSFMLMTTTVLPWLFEIGHENHQSVGLSAQYSAVAMLSIATYLTWIFGLILASWLVMFTAGQLGLLTQITSQWWRIRVHGITAVLILLTVPEQAQALSIPLVVFAMASNEFFARPWLSQPSLVSGRITDWFDVDGQRRRLAVVQIDGQDEGIDPEHARKVGFSLLTVQNWHEQQSDREKIAVFIQHHRITDVVVLHGEVDELPDAVLENFHRLGITTHGKEHIEFRGTSAHPFTSILSSKDRQDG